MILDYFAFADSKFGGRFSFLTIIGLHVLINIATSSLSFYLAIALSNISEGKQNDLSEHSSLGGNLILIVVICLVTTIIGKMTSSMIFMSINRSLHSKIVSSVILTNMQFYDENTSGRILNRMSKDIAVSDQIVFNFLDMVDYIIKCSFSLVFIMFSSPVTIIVVIL